MRKLYILAVVLLCFSYPITTVWLLRLGVTMSTANLIIKSVIASLFVISLLVLSKRDSFSAKVPMSMLIFFAIYSVRILYDVLVLKLVIEYQSPIYIFGYYFVLTIIPIVTIVTSIRRSDTETLHKWAFAALIAANLSLLAHAFLSGTVSADTAFSGRMQVEGEMEGTTVLNPIIFSLMGSILSSFILGRFATGLVVGARSLAFHIGLLGFGIANILFGGSRGPAIGFILCVFVTLYTLSRQGPSNLVSRTQHTAWLALGGLGAGLAMLAVTNIIPIFLFDRFGSLVEERTTGGLEERDYLFADAWADFIGAPFVGNSYILSVGDYLPHNIFLEALMATGIVGGIFFFWMFFRAAQGIWNILNGSIGPYGNSLAMTAICFMTLGFTSYSVCQSPELWVFVTLMLVLGSMSQRASVPHAAGPRQLRFAR
jgi:hypothetical protein